MSRLMQYILVRVIYPMTQRIISLTEASIITSSPFDVKYLPSCEGSHSRPFNQNIDLQDSKRQVLKTSSSLPRQKYALLKAIILAVLIYFNTMF